MIHKVSQHVHIHSWKRWLKKYTAATTMRNTMVTVHKSDNTCSVHFGNIRRTIISKTICKIRNVSVNKIYLSLSACKQVRHYIIHWMTALGDTLVFGCTLVEIVQLTHTDKYYPSPVHWIALCYMAFPKTKHKSGRTTLPECDESEEAAGWPHLLLVNLS